MMADKWLKMAANECKKILDKILFNIKEFLNLSVNQFILSNFGMVMKIKYSQGDDLKAILNFNSSVFNFKD